MLFCGGSENASRYILRRRLEECAKLLSSALWRGHTITEIAFSSGFNSAAHFTRVFRDEYGDDADPVPDHASVLTSSLTASSCRPGEAARGRLVRAWRPIGAGARKDMIEVSRGVADSGEARP